jgi:hypothetical protein
MHFESKVDFFQDVLATDLPVYSMGSGAINTFLQAHTDPLMIGLNKRITESNGFFTPKKGVPRKVIEDVSKNQAILMRTG